MIIIANLIGINLKADTTIIVRRRSIKNILQSDTKKQKYERRATRSAIFSFIINVV
jgi:hypothetical protein